MFPDFKATYLNTPGDAERLSGFFIIMKITIVRPEIQDLDYTISKLYINNEHFCDVMEDRDRNLFSNDLKTIKALKVKHKTAIPYGVYEVVLSYSERFKKFLPLLTNVPGFLGIRIHAGNTEVDSSGCLLPGISDGRSVKKSIATTSKLIKVIESTLKKEKVFIEIVPSIKDNHLFKQALTFI